MTPPPPRSRRRPTPSNPLPGRPLVLEQLEDRTVPSTSTLHTVLGTLSFDPDQVSRSTILVGFHDAAKDHTGYSATAGTTAATRLDLLPGYYIVQLAPGVSVEQALSAYAASGLVAEVSPDYLLTAEATPNDPRFVEQWALNNASGGDVNAPAAWDLTRGGTRTVVSVMDTGIDYNHVDLYKNIWLNQGEIPTTRRGRLTDTDGDGKITFIDLNQSVNQGVGKITDQNGDGRITANDLLAPMRKTNGVDNGQGGWADGVSNDGDRYVDDFVGWNFVNDTNRPDDDNNHGTHVAGIIGATGNNATGVTGVAWVTQMMAIKFMNDEGRGSIGSFIAGLDYAVTKGAKVSNNSWAGGTFTSLLYEAIAEARDRGHVYVAAAGNAGTNIDINHSYPASYDVTNMIVVASSNRSDGHSTFSNYGVGTVDLSAPGEGILSTLPGNRYGVMSGTSMAAPHVTGTVALVWARNPSWTSAQVINKVLGTVDKKSALSTKVATGGRLNTAAAVGATSPPVENQAPKVLSSVATGAETNTLNKISVTFNEPINPTTMTAAAVRLLGPSGKLISLTSVKAVTGTSNKKWELNFLTQNTPGTYSLQLSSAIKDTQGAALPNYYTTFTIAKTATYTNPASQAIPDNGTITSTIKVNQNAKVQNVTVKVNIGHTYDRDLALYLVAPNGTKITLAYRVGGSGDNFTNTVFSDAGSKPIDQGVAPFTGTFRPTQALSTLKNMPTLGNWKLIVQDLATGDRGTLLNWSLTITTTNGLTQSTGTTKSASIQGFAEEEPLVEGLPEESVPPATDRPSIATLSATVSGAGVVGSQLVSPITGPTTPVRTVEPAASARRTSTTAGWLARDLEGPADTPRAEPAPSQRPPRHEEAVDWTASDLVFQEVRPLEPTEATEPATAPEPRGEGLDEEVTELV